MSRSSHEIHMDYERAKTQAERLEKTADGLSQTADDLLGNVLAGIRVAWDGDVSAVFTKKVQKVQNELHDRAKELYKIAAAIRKIAANTYNAEMRAYNLASKRDS